MLYLNKRQILILRYLINASEALSSELLASVVGTTSRTVRNDIRIIDQIFSRAGARIISKAGTGYAIDVYNKDEFLVFMDCFTNKYNNVKIPNYNIERIGYIINKLLVENDYIKGDLFIDTLFISRVTLSKDLKNIRIILGKYHLTLEHKPNHGLIIMGKEQHKRIALCDYLFIDEDITMIQDQILRSKLDIIKCRTILNYHLGEHNIHVSFQTVDEIIKLIVINEVRAKQNLLVEFTDTELFQIKEYEEYNVAVEILSDLCILSNDAEVSFLGLYIAARRIYGLEDQFSLVKNNIPYNLSLEMIKYLYKYSNIDLSVNQEVPLMIARELRALTLRVVYGFELRNMPIIAIKQKKLVFEYAVLMSNYLTEKFGWYICEEEIAAISNLLFVDLGINSLCLKKSRICLVFYRGKSSTAIVRNILMNSFVQLIDSIGACEYYELNQEIEKNYDLIITDMPRIYFNCNIPVYEANDLLTNFDNSERNKMKDLLHYKEDKFSAFICGIKQDLIFKDLELDSKEEVIQYITEKMCLKYKISSDLYEYVMNREKVSSGEVGTNTAIVHSLFPICEDTCIAIAILNHSITWNNELVKLVFVVANGKNENYTFMIIDWLQGLLNNIKCIDILLKFNDYGELKDLLYNFINKSE